MAASVSQASKPVARAADVRVGSAKPHPCRSAHTVRHLPRVHPVSLGSDCWARRYLSAATFCDSLGAERSRTPAARAAALGQRDRHWTGHTATSPASPSESSSRIVGKICEVRRRGCRFVAAVGAVRPIPLSPSAVLPAAIRREGEHDRLESDGRGREERWQGAAERRRHRYDPTRACLCRHGDAGCCGCICRCLRGGRDDERASHGEGRQQLLLTELEVDPPQRHGDLGVGRGRAPQRHRQDPPWPGPVQVAHYVPAGRPLPASLWAPWPIQRDLHGPSTGDANDGARPLAAAFPNAVGAQQPDEPLVEPTQAWPRSEWTAGGQCREASSRRCGSAHSLRLVLRRSASTFEQRARRLPQ